MNNFRALARHANIISKNCKITNVSKLPSVRQLYSPASLRLPSFLESQENVRRMMHDQDTFKKKLADCCASDSNYLILSDDLKKMVYLVQDDDDLVLLHKMLKRFNQQSHSVIFQSFKFGPEVMRLLYMLKRPQDALNFFKDPELNSLFLYANCYLLLMDLLFESEMYAEVVNVYHCINNTTLNTKKYIHTCVTLFFAACYKLNTPESFDNATNLWEQGLADGFNFPLRATLFFAMLALNQNHSYAALELLAKVRKYSPGLNIKFRALAQAKRFEDVLAGLTDLLFADQQYQNSFITSDTLHYLEKAFEADCNLKKFEKIKEDLRAHNLIQEQPLETFLFEQIEIKNNSFNERSPRKKVFSYSD